jgi:hypothetical protein
VCVYRSARSIVSSSLPLESRDILLTTNGACMFSRVHRCSVP